MTGWYPHTRGHRTMHNMLSRAQGETTLLEQLKEAGYFVWWGGKNDLVKVSEGFDHVCDVRFKPSESDYARWNRIRIQGRGLDFQERWRGVGPEDPRYYGFFSGELEASDSDGKRYADNDWANILGAIDFIDSYEGDAPLCIYLSLSYPHPPYGVEDPWYSLIDREKIPARIPGPAEGYRESAMRSGIRAAQGLSGQPESWWRELRAVYYAMCARVDAQVGMIRSALEARGFWDDTAFFFFSDHGDYTGDYGVVEKTQNTFEDCLVNVPFVVKPPAGVPVVPGVRDALVELTDLSATVCELAAIRPPYRAFGESLLPVVSGQRGSGRDAVFAEGGRARAEREADEHESLRKFKDPRESQYWPRLRLQTESDCVAHGKATMCRTERYKYVARLYDADELYDLVEDPEERRNIADDPRHKDILEALRKRTLRWYMETADIVPMVSDSRGD